LLEFRAMEILNDALYLLNKNHGDVVYRVPLSVIVDYKGFRCLVLSTPPINNEDTLFQGPLVSEGTYRVNKTIEEDLRYLAKSLNLKEHKFFLDDKLASINIFLSVFAEIHKVVFTGYDDDKKNALLEENGDKLTFSEKKNPDSFYLMKTADIFPVDIDLESRGPTSFLKRLRYIFPR